MTRQQKFEKLCDNVDRANNSGDVIAFERALENLAEFCWRNRSKITVASESRSPVQGGARPLGMISGSLPGVKAEIVNVDVRPAWPSRSPEQGGETRP